MKRRAPDIHIDELVLYGAHPSDRAKYLEAIQDEVSKLFSNPADGMAGSEGRQARPDITRAAQEVARSIHAQISETRGS